jgi:hypothetical protein
LLRKGTKLRRVDLIGHSWAWLQEKQHAAAKVVGQLAQLVEGESRIVEPKRVPPVG